jgi:hypothetical protein
MIVNSRMHVIKTGDGNRVGVGAAGPTVGLPSTAVGDAANLFDIHMD